ncbi:MAG: UDP-3-O-(3-hydroxymyristoyl)glucosamine N-acyltransferase [Porticoccaceae bacterium]|jgi:UDP-3-O-[3-hydroxymyristoyl] glucosamine N-acyltransferase|nr:UDP-3-O-(3-hydroxymyristoyl)glucosamine N-acyltransferase [Porticoccaceae bacterium]
MTTSFALRELADYLKADLQGDPGVHIHRLNTLKDAGPGELAFLASRAYQSQLAATRASAVILAPRDAGACPCAALIHPNPYVAYARVSALFDPAPVVVAGIHPSAVVDGSAQVDPSAAVGPHGVVGAGVRIGAGTVIGAGCVIGEDAVIGDHCHLHANVTLYHGVSLGHRVVIHGGAVIGADGFGFANGAGRWVKIHQLGSVEIGDDVEIGAGTTIDRGALGNTVIGNNVIIDNLVQIAHNVRIGDHSALAGCAAIAGSTVVGARCVLGGGAGLVGHIELCDGVTVTARSMITHSITRPGVYSSGTPFDDNGAWKRNAVRFGQLDDMARRLRALEKQQKR